MRTFNLDQLQSFVSICETGSLSAAAAALYRSQSSISEHLQKLEALCDSTLVIRNKRGASMTPAGERLLRHAKNLLLSNDRAIADMQGLTLEADLYLGITDYLLPGTIAPMLKRLGATYPGLRIRVEVQSSTLLEQAQRSKKYDIALYMRMPGEQTAAAEVIRSEALCWAAHEHWVFDASQPLPIVTLPPGCTLQKYALGLLDDAAIHYSLWHSASSVSGLLSAVQAGLGVGCVHRSALPPGVKPVDSSGQLPELAAMELCMHSRKGREEIAAELRRFISGQLAAS
jgi:DNA-binding transcriptional LysR family regulator